MIMKRPGALAGSARVMLVLCHRTLPTALFADPPGQNAPWYRPSPGRWHKPTPALTSSTHGPLMAHIEFSAGVDAATCVLSAPPSKELRGDSKVKPFTTLFSEEKFTYKHGASDGER